MTTSIKTSADGTQAIIQVNGVDKLVVSANGIEPGSYKAGSITQSDLATAASSIGVGQTWQDVTGSRALGTTYTNSTGKPIFVATRFVWHTSAGEILATVGGVAAQTAKGNSTYSAYPQFGFIVPDGATYVLTLTFGVAPTTLAWSELR